MHVIVVVVILKVLLKKEQEYRVKLELQVAELEEQVERQTSDLSSAREEHEKLKADLSQERQNKQVLVHMCHCVWLCVLYMYCCLL